MRFPVQFSRQKGAASLDPLLGSDAIPDGTTSTQGKPSTGICMSHREQRLAEPMKRIAVAFWYTGAGDVSSLTLPVEIWVADEESARWYKASLSTLANGVMTYLRCPVLSFPPQVQANLGNPGHSVDVMIIVKDNTAPTGVYKFIAGPDLVEF